MTTETTDATIHMRRVVIKDVIDGAMEPHPFNRFAGLPAFSNRRELRIVFLDLRVAVHAGLRVRHIRLRRHFDKAVAIAAIHSELGHVNVVRERHRLDRLIAYLGIFWRDVIPRRRAQSARDQNAGDCHLQRQPVAPAWKEVRHNQRKPDPDQHSRQLRNEFKSLSGCARIEAIIL